MKYRHAEIERMKNFAREAERQVNDRDNIYSAVNGYTLSARAIYNEVKVSKAGPIEEYKHEIEYSNDPTMVENSKNDYAFDMKEVRTAESNYIAKLIGVRMAVQNKIEARGALSWLFHPIRTYRENQAMKIINESFKELKLNEDTIEGYDTLLSSVVTPLEATVNKDGLSIPIDAANPTPEQITMEYEEKSVEIEPFQNSNDEPVRDKVADL